MPSKWLCVLIVCSAFAAAQVPPSNHVILLVEENTEYEEVFGNSQMPYFNSLASTYGLATNYDANGHWSINNYMWLTAGAYVTNDNGSTSTYNVDNVTNHLDSANKTWKDYQDSLPSVGYTFPDAYPYVAHHNPMAYFANVVNSNDVNNIVPFSEFATDVQNGTLPNYSFITPNMQDDCHRPDDTLAHCDSWLQANIGPLLASKYFQPGGDGILFITFDESIDSDCRPLTSCPTPPQNQGGGRVFTLVIGPNVKPGYRSTVFYQHPSILRTMLDALGVTTYPGAAASAPDMADFFQAQGTPSVSLSKTSLSFPRQVVNTASNSQAVTLTNNGSATLTITSIVASGDFSQTNTCGSSVAAGGNCTITVSFTPTTKNKRTGTITITDNAAGSPQSIALTGIGTFVQLSTSRLAFPATTVGTTSAPQSVTITNAGNANVNFTGFSVTGTNPGDFTATPNCPSSLAPSANCSVSVTFKPTATGSRSASLRITDDGGGSPQVVALSGKGQ